jgi:hypothetical protein
MTSNKSFSWVIPAALGALLAGASFAGAQTTPQAAPKAAPAKKATPKAKAPAPPALEPKALDILKASSAVLAAAKSMTFTADVSYESPTRQGPPLVYVTQSDVTMVRPNKLRVITPGDGPPSEFYYDGKVMMAYAPTENLLAVADAPPTVDAALEAAFSSAAIYYPFTDVIVTDPYKDLSDGLTLAYYVGQSHVIAGITTDIVAYVTNGVFIQAWIGADDKLPRILRAIYLADKLKQRHILVLSNWKLNPDIAPDVFGPSNAASAKRIKFAHPSAPPPPGAVTPPKAKPAKTQPPQ